MNEAPEPAPSHPSKPVPAIVSEPPFAPVFVPWLLVFILVATLAKLALLVLTRGSSDADIWLFFALHVQHWGLTDAYSSIGAQCNHPPLALAMESQALILGKAISYALGYEIGRYPGSPFFWLRLPSLLADLASLFLMGPLLRARLGARPARVMVAALAVSPLTWLVGVWAVNTDLVWSALVIAAVLVLEWPFPYRAVYQLRIGPLRLADLVYPSPSARAVVSGALVALGVAIKTPAIVALAPLGMIAERERRGALFGLGFLLPTIALMIPGFVGSGYPFVEYVLGYKGTLTAVPWIPERFARELVGEDARLWLLFHGHLLVGVAAATLALAWARRGRPGDALGATYAAVLLVLPVFGGPYLVWGLLPLALLGWRPALYFHVAGLFQAWIIYAVPLDKFITPWEKAHALSVWPAVSTWCVLLGVVVVALFRRPQLEVAQTLEQRRPHVEPR